MDPLVNRMDMGSSAPPHSCKISMLWNWYTIDTCFIARSWHVKSKGGFAGSCIGVFFLVMVSQWLHRFAREYDVALITKYSQLDNVAKEADSEASYLAIPPQPELYTVSHRWLWKPLVADGVRPSTTEHLIRGGLFTLEWGLSYMIMLLFMYYNGYIIISCILGAFFGRLIFTYNEPLSGNCLADSNDLDKKCCR
ncbi:CIC11C00000005130 [Sungouiella intermedia]|uniref:Copper transport protein n=1 Tax=Sungouiella intermedia TaxID=45354 RepID=A0A1L0DI77_9ASCO|nr:CIC11C00000005130 [[Candida] intermedia]